MVCSNFAFKIVIKGEIENRMEELYHKNREHVKKFMVWKKSQEKEIEEPEEEETYISDEAVEFLAEKFEV